MAEQNEEHFEVHSKNHDVKYQADKFDLAIKNWIESIQVFIRGY